MAGRRESDLLDEEKFARANRASALLRDELFNEAFEKIREAIQRQWENAPARDHEGREQLWMRMKALKDVRAYIEQVANDAKVVIDLERKKRLFKF